LIDSLLLQEYKNIIATDISELALRKSQERLGCEKASLVKWIEDDITKSVHSTTLQNVALWHDRAVLHFLLKEEQRQAYLSTLRKVLKKEGYVIISAFSVKGAKKCSGLDICNYDEKMPADFLGKDFKLKDCFYFTHYLPSGTPRPYIYTRFQRVN